MADRFDIEKVTRAFTGCLKDEDDVLLGEYLAAYEEINKFFLLLGSIFNFVSSDIRSKLDILLAYKQSNSTQFSSVKTMMNYEKSANKFADKKYVSGSRTLLRLHRGLEFVYEFLLRLGKISDSDKTCDSCKEAYNDSLAKHHAFLIRKGAVVAMHALPTKGELLKRVCTDVPQAKQLLPEMLKKTRIVYDRIDKLFTKYDLHKLP